MPAYNAEHYLGEAIKSILSQSFEDFELILIDDGSNDGSLAVMRSFEAEDTRIRIISRANKGLIFSLNEAIAQARGEYIARMDADDIALTERFRKQIEFLDANPDVSLCGCCINIIRGNRTFKARPQPATHEAAKVQLLFCPPVPHPAVMFRKSFVDKYGLTYSMEYTHCEDYELWSRWIEYGKLANLSDYLMCYREHDNQISVTEEETLKPNHLKVTARMLAKIDITMHEEQRAIFIGKSQSSKGCSELLDMFEQVMKMNLQHNVYHQKYLRRELAHRLEIAVLRHYGLRGFKVYLTSELFTFRKLLNSNLYIMFLRICIKTLKRKYCKRHA